MLKASDLQSPAWKPRLNGPHLFLVLTGSAVCAIPDQPGATRTCQWRKKEVPTPNRLRGPAAFEAEPAAVQVHLPKWRRRRISKPHAACATTLALPMPCLAFRLTSPRNGGSGGSRDPTPLARLLRVFKTRPLPLGLRFQEYRSEGN